MLFPFYTIKLFFMFLILRGFLLMVVFKFGEQIVDWRSWRLPGQKNPTNKTKHLWGSGRSHAREIHMTISNSAWYDPKTSR